MAKPETPPASEVGAQPALPDSGHWSLGKVASYEARLLERVSLGAPLDEVLGLLTRGFEALWPDTITSVQLVEPDGRSMRVGAGPSLPPSHLEPTVRFPIGPRHGSCGTAAHRGEIVVVSDIASDPIWTDWLHFALPHGLMACWSVPIFDSAHKVVATFAVYHRAPRTPSEDELALVQRVAHIVRIALDTERREQARRLAEAKLARSESLLRFAGTAARVGGWALTLASRELTWTDVCYDIFEVPPGERPDFDHASALTLPEWRDALTEASLRCQADGTPFSLELRSLTAKGRPIWLKVMGEAERDSHGIIVGLRGAVVEITEQRETLDALREREAMYQIASQVGRMGGWRVEVPSLRHRWSAEALAILGAGPNQELSRKDVHLRFAEIDRPTLKAAFDGCEQEGRPFDHEVRVVRLDGRVIWVRIIGESVRDESGNITAVHGAIQDIDELVRLRQRTRELADRLVATLESLSDPFLTLARAWCITYLNAAAEHILKRPRSQVVGRPISQVFQRFEGSPVEQAMTEAMTRGLTGRVEAYSKTLARWVDVTAYPTPEGMAAYIKDVTELHQSRAALTESQERFALLASATNDAIWDWRVEQNVLWWNEGLKTLFGYEPTTVDPSLRSWTDYIHPDDRERVLESLEKALGQSAKFWREEYRFRHAMGHFLHVIDRGHIIRNAEGRATRMVGGISDLTERKRAEDRLREQAMLLDKAQDAIIVLTLDHRVRYWNKSAEALYGWSFEEAGNTSFELLVHEDPAVFRSASAAVVARGEWVGEVEQVTRMGRRVIVEGRWTLLTNERGEPSGILALHTDVTEKRRLEQQFLRAQRLESIGTLAGGIAHDLNNMLTPILMTTSILRTDPANAPLEEDLASIQGCAERGAQMVRQLLVFARGSDGKRAQVSIRTVAADVHKFMRETLPKNIGVQLVAPNDIWDIDADATQIHQLITNLCVNARDAMPHGGLLTIALENTSLDEVYTGMNLEARPGPYVLLRVEDTGLGMSPDVVDRIFEPFFTTKAFGQGTGLGLSTVHAIVRGHKGFIHVYSEPGRGSRFKVYLPATQAVTEDSKVRAEPVQLPRGRGELILVVDDEEIIRHVTTRMLERYGYRVVTAQNGAEAVAIYVQMREQIALVLTDMSMPVMDGPATIVALRAIDPHVKIIGSSGLNANGHLAKAVDAGVEVFVPKPYTADSMLRTVRRVLG